MSDPNATQALQAAIEAANPQLDSKEDVTPAVTASPEVEDEEGTDDDAGEEAGESEVVTDENGEPLAEQPKRKSRKERAREKVNAEIARRIKAEQEVERLRVERDQALAVKSQPAQDDEEPLKTKADFFFDDDKYAEYLADRKFKKRLADEQKATESKKIEQAEQTFAERAGKFREEAADFDDVALKTPLGPYYTQDVIEAIRDSDTGPQLAYYLGQNLAETEALLKMPAAQRARAIGKIEARLEADTAPATASRQAAASQPPRTVTRAPAVGSTVTASSPGAKSLADWDIKDHIEKIRVKR
jgi:hypothetical protein